ncbi:MAG TPA: helix-turn-helix domain-containing protein [Lacunisphaera sp.]|nr:helix-turn-helix domain-containing protein [Lacunisphaera sp.]
MDTASTVLKALDTLTILAGSSNGLPLPELAQALNQPRSNVVRLLGSLQGYGLVTREGRAWKVTPAFREWSAPPDRYAALRQRYRPIIEEIAAGTGELVLIGLHEGNGVVHLDYVESDHRIRVAPAPTTRHNLRHNAMGKLALSRRPDLAARFRDPALQKELEEIRQTGVAWNREETVQGMIAMAVPGLTNTPTEPIIVVAWPTLRFTEAAATKARKVIREALARAQR